MKKLNLSLWGCGSRTNRIVDSALPHGKISISSCYDINPSTAKSCAEKYQAKRLESEEELLGQKNIDAFLISLYPGAHAGALLKCAQLGKPIYIEKPVATNWEAWRNLKNLDATSKTYIHVGLMHRYLSFFETITEVIQSGKIGKLTGVTCNWIVKLRSPEEFPGGRDNWHFRKDTGGELAQHFCHAFDWLRVIGGDFSEISARCNHLLNTDLPIENTWDLSLGYKSGAMVNFHSSMFNPRNTEMGWFEGSEGSLEYEWSLPSRLLYFPNTHRKQAGEPIPIKNVDSEIDITAGFFKFLENLEKGGKPDITLKDGLWAALIPLLARESASKKQTLKIDEYWF